MASPTFLKKLRAVTIPSMPAGFPSLLLLRLDFANESTMLKREAPPTTHSGRRKDQEVFAIPLQTLMRNAVPDARNISLFPPRAQDPQARPHTGRLSRSELRAASRITLKCGL